MEDAVGHLGNDLGIDQESSSSHSSDEEESISRKKDHNRNSATKKPKSAVINRLRIYDNLFLLRSLSFIRRCC